MRFGLVVPDVADLNVMRRIGAAVDESAFDVVCFLNGTGPAAWWDPVVGAEALGEVTTHARIMLEVVAGVEHPLLLAESLASLDAATTGRLEVIARRQRANESHEFGNNPRAADSRFSEAVEVLQRAWGCRPFRFTGEHWTIPGRLESNGDLSTAVQMTTRPNQLDVPLWILTDGTGERFERLGRPAASRSRAQVLDVDDLDLAVARLDRMAATGTAIALIRFSPSDTTAAMLAFCRYVTPRYGAVELPGIVIDSMLRHRDLAGQ